MEITGQLTYGPTEAQSCAILVVYREGRGGWLSTQAKSMRRRASFTESMAVRSFGVRVHWLHT